MKYILMSALLLLAPALSVAETAAKNPKEMTDEDWRKKLTPEQYRVLREKGTEAPYTGILHNNKEPGIYRCVGCQQVIFKSDEKFESGTGWPSFTQPVSRDAVIERPDISHGMDRVEVLCARCGGHLGHVFNDGPPPTGLRYCINSCALSFNKKEKEKK